MVHSLIGVIVVATLSFVGTMFDNFFAFAAQLALTERHRFKRVSAAQALGVATLIVLAAGAGTILIGIPLRWIGALCLAPWALAYFGWRNRSKPAHEQYRRGALTTFTLSLALGGDNLAVWIPLLRANGSFHEVVTIAVFGFWEVVFVLSAQSFASAPPAQGVGRPLRPVAHPPHLLRAGSAHPDRVRDLRLARQPGREGTH